MIHELREPHDVPSAAEEWRWVLLNEPVRRAQVARSRNSELPCLSYQRLARQLHSQPSQFPRIIAGVEYVLS
jgi:hypothetical protein